MPRKTKSKSKSKSMKVKKGGMAPSCISSPNVDKYMASCHTANIHNSNPQASLDLDSKFMNYKNSIPLSQSGGKDKYPANCSCGAKLQSFEEYMNNISKQLGQRGGAYSVNPEEMIAGLPIYQKYDDCCPPAVVGGKLKLSNIGDPICNAGVNKTGGSKSKRTNKKNTSKKVKKSKTNKSKTNKSQKNKSKGNKSRKNMKGGMYRSSKPADFPKSFETVKSNFSDDMKTRVFDETQPNYSVNQI